MRLADFILAHQEEILTEWVAFARSRFPVAHQMDLPTLRDHAAEMLQAIATDLNTTQSRSEQLEKSEGKSDAKVESSDPDTAAQSHGDARALSGFNVEEMVSEYRALRASVIRLWTDKTGEVTREGIEDLMRFNEAIDQALAESTARYTQNIDHSKEMFLAMLGHDLRTPLGAIIASAQVITNTKTSRETALKSASIILSSGRRMNALVDDLLDFTRSRLGNGIPIDPAHMDIEKVCRQTVQEVAALHPDRAIHIEVSGELVGTWDGARVSQALSNLISNAVQYGSPDTPIDVTLSGAADEIAIAVRNRGSVIPAHELNRIFDPMHRIDQDNSVAPRSNLGLGLYITERIVAAHSGTISVESSADTGTAFTIHLPKSRAA